MGAGSTGLVRWDLVYPLSVGQFLSRLRRLLVRAHSIHVHDHDLRTNQRLHLLLTEFVGYYCLGVRCPACNELHTLENDISRSASGEVGYRYWSEKAPVFAADAIEILIMDDS
jgi:hypothetical protein